MRVNAPDGTPIDFPDTMSHEDVTAVMQKKFPPTSTPAKPKEQNYIGSPTQIGKLMPEGNVAQRLLKDYLAEAHSGMGAMSEGVQKVKKGRYGAGAGEAALGAAQWALAPINAPIKSLISDPLANATGSPMVGDVAGFMTPVGGLRATGEGAKIIGGLEKFAENSPIARTMKRVIAPNLLTPESQETDKILTAVRGTRKQAGAQAEHSLEAFRPIVNKMSDQERADVRQWVDGDKSIKLSPDGQALADRLEGIYKQYRGELESHPMTEHVGMKEDYMARDWEKPDKAEDLTHSFFAKQGSGKNLAKRKYLTEKEGLDAGLKLRTTDPIDTTIKYAKNMDSYLAHADAFHALQEKGLIAYPKKPPAGWSKIDGRFSEKMFKDVGEDGQPIVVKHQAYAPDAVASTFNRYISGKAKGLAGEAIDVATKATNAATSAKMLFGSLYHTMTVAKTAVASAVKNSFSDIAHGDVRGAANKFTGGMKALYGTKGNEYLDHYLGKKPIDPAKKPIADAMLKADAYSVKAPDYMVTGRGRSLWSAAARKVKGIEDSLPKTIKADLKDLYKDKGVLGKVAETINYIGSAVSEPVFNHWIPRVKTGVVAEALETWHGQNPKASPAQLEEKAREVSRMVDNHFGEMNRDKTYWSRTAKDVAGLTFLSYSWVTGTLTAAARGAGSIGKTLLRGDPLTEEGKMMVATMATDAVLSSVYQYLKTGKAPESKKDLFFPQTGATRSGAPERAVLPGHESQLRNYLTDPINELSNELSPLLSGIYGIARGKDYFDRPEDRGALAAEQLLPIPAQSLMSRQKGTGISVPETVLGIRPASQAISNPKAKEYYEEKALNKADKAREKYKNK